MKQWRLVESYPITGKRGGKRIHITIWRGEDKEALQRQIKAWCAKPRKPYAEIAYYYGSKRVSASEL
jgi:hypothetical protein